MADSDFIRLHPLPTVPPRIISSPNVILYRYPYPNLLCSEVAPSKVLHTGGRKLKFVVKEVAGITEHGFKEGNLGLMSFNLIISL